MMTPPAVCLAIAASMFLSVPSPALSEDGSKVLMIVRDGSRDLELMLAEEVGVMKEMLEASGYRVDVVTETGEVMQAGGEELSPNLKASEVDVSDYAGIALPCMAPAPGHPLAPELLPIVKAFVAEGKPILAARGSVAIVAKAGGLEGKKYAFASDVDVNERPEFESGEFMGTGVVRDGNVSTSGICPLAAKSTKLPDGTQDVTRSFIESLKATN